MSETANAEYNRRLVAAIRASEWQDIATAPKDGTWVLVYTDKIPDEGSDVRNICVAQWSDYLNGGTTEPRWMFAWYDGGFYGDCGQPTHWQPLPSPPIQPLKGE